jgi:DNA repair photolyase
VRCGDNVDSRWSDLIEIKVNAVELLRKEVSKRKKGLVMISTVTDPYQSIEGEYEITRKCLGILLDADWSVSILTKSPLVTRDIDILRKFRDIKVGITINTDSEVVKNNFEKNTPSIEGRIEALRRLHESGVRTYTFVGPILPMTDARKLATLLKPISDNIIFDRMNYVEKSIETYRRHCYLGALGKDYYSSVVRSFGEVAEGSRAM